MRNFLITLVLFPILIIGSIANAKSLAADLVLTNGYLYTVDNVQTVAEALAVKGGKIIFVGSNDQVKRFIGPDTDVRDLDGKMVMPGLIDAHIHPLAMIPSDDACTLSYQPVTLDEMVPFVKGCLERKALPVGEWLPVIQWNPFLGNQPSNQHPNLRAALDAVSTEHPIILWGGGGHSAAANSLALKGAKNPDNGEVVGLSASTMATVFSRFKDFVAVDEKGELTGALYEVIRYQVRSEMLQDMLGGLDNPSKLMPAVAQKLAVNGITSILDARVTEKILQHYRWLEESGQMTFRVRTSLFQQTPGSDITKGVADIEKYIEQFKVWREEYQGLTFVKPDGVKLYADGLFSGNPLTSPPELPRSAMLQGYEQPIFSVNGDGENLDVAVEGYVDFDSPQCKAVNKDPNRYEDRVEAERFNAEYGYFPSQCRKFFGVLDHSETFIHEFVRLATEAGFNIHIHGEADRGIRVALDAFEKTRSLAEKKGVTQSIAHVGIAHPDDQLRFGEIGVFPVFTYAWITPDEYLASSIPFIDQVKGKHDLFNPEHYSVKNLFAVKAISNSGADVVFGSDTPVGTLDPIPFVSMQQALTRSGHGVVIGAQHRIDIHETIASFTINGAKLLGQDDKLGSLEVGKIADLIVLDTNVVNLAENGKANEISKTNVLLTVFDGNVIYEKE